MLELTDTSMAMACWPSDSGFAASDVRINKGVCGSRVGHRLSLHAARYGSALFRNFTVVAPVKLQLSTSLLNLNMLFVKGLMAINDSTKCGLVFRIGRLPWGSGPGFDSTTTLSRNITMAFVNENIPEADLQRIDFASVIHPLHSCPIDTPSKWTIDRERDIALISLGGGSGENSMYPSFFLMYWQGKFVEAYLVASTTGNLQTHDLEVTWTLRYLGQLDGVPESLFLITLKQALTCFGYIDITLRERIKDVKFIFDNNIVIRG
jgi:hypothetical protein